MKRKMKRLILAVCLLLMMTGCGAGGREPVKEEGQTDGNTAEGEAQTGRNTAEGEVRIRKIEVYSAVQNEAQIYHVRYPYDFYAFGDGKCSMYDLDQHVESEDLSQEQAQYFVDYVFALPDSPEPGAGEDLSYYIILNYQDESGEDEYLYRIGYDTFPEGWETFIDRYNEILGGEYLARSGGLQRVTPEFLTEVFGVTDEDVKEGTLQDVIDVMGLNIKEITDLFYIDSALDGYYAAAKEDEIEPYRPKELVSVDSTQEEYDAFVAKYLKEAGLDSSEEIESDQDYFRRFYDSDADGYFYIARTADMDQLPTRETDDGYFEMELDAHMEGMTFNQSFVYNADQKYILLFYDENPDKILPFCRLQ